MSLLRRQVRRLWDSVSVVLFVLAFLQVPHFLELYRHRLDEQRVQTERTLAQLEISPTRDPTTIEIKRTELAGIRDRLETASRADLRRFLVFATLDLDLAKRTLEDMKPGLTLDSQSLALGAAGVVAGLVFAGLTAGFVGLFLPRRHAMTGVR